MFTPKVGKYIKESVVDVLCNAEMPNDKARDFKPLTWHALQGLFDLSTDEFSKPEPARDKLLHQKLQPAKCFCVLETPVVGEFGAFYQGFDTVSWNRVTFKIFKPKIFQNKVSCTEKQILSLTAKPYSIPTLLVAFRFQLKNCLVLEPLATTSLQEKLMFCRRFSPSVVLFFMSNIVLAVSYLHIKGIVHRSLTLDVFWIQNNGHLKLADFSRCMLHGSIRFFPMTQKNIDSAPPETFDWGWYTKDVDVWAIGVMLYRMVSGRKPFYGVSRSHLVQVIQEENVTFNKLFDHETAEFCHKLLQKNPQHRLCHGLNTFLCISNEDYFATVKWDEVLSGQAKAPDIPLLFSAVRDERMSNRRLNLRRKSQDRSIKMRKTPLRYLDISTKESGEMFNVDILNKIHDEKMARHKKDASFLKLSSRKSSKKYSFQDVSRKTFPPAPTYGIMKNRTGWTTSSSSSNEAMKNWPNSAGTESSGNSQQEHLSCTETDLSFLFFRLSLEKLFSTAINNLEIRMKEGADTIKSLSEFREFMDMKIYEMLDSM